jgi:hypothetical protein
MFYIIDAIQCVSALFKITGLLNFVHRPVLFINGKRHRFGTKMCFHLQVSWETCTYLCPLERAKLYHWTSQSRYAPRLTRRREQLHIRNVVFSSYLEFRTMHKVQKPDDSQCYTPMPRTCGSVVVKALCYKPEGRGFDSRWGEFLHLPNPSGRTRPWGLLSL